MFKEFCVLNITFLSCGYLKKRWMPYFVANSQNTSVSLSNRCVVLPAPLSAQVLELTSFLLAAKGPMPQMQENLDSFGISFLYLYISYLM